MMNFDAMIALLPAFACLVLTLTYGSYALKRGNDLKKTWLTATLINLLIIGGTSIWWFMMSRGDSLNLFVGLMIYGISFLLIGVIYTIAFASMRSRRNNT